MLCYFCPICGKDLGIGPAMNATPVCRGKCYEVWLEREFAKLHKPSAAKDAENKEKA